MLGKKEEEYLKKQRQYKMLRYYYIIAMFIFILINSTLAIIGGFFADSYVRVHFFIPGFMFFFVSILILVVTYFELKKQSRRVHYELYYDEGILEKVYDTEYLNARRYRVRKILLNKVRVLFPPHINQAHAQLTPSLRVGEPLKKVKLIIEREYDKHFLQAYILGFTDCNLIEEDYDKYIKPYRLGINGISMMIPLAMALICSAPLLIKDGGALTFLEKASLFNTSLLILSFAAQIPFLLNNLMIKMRYRKFLNL